MPLPFERNCQVLLTAISQSVGQINGTAFGCERWNVPSLKNLQDQLVALTRGSACRKAFTDQLLDEESAYVGGALMSVGPLDSMLKTVQGVLEEYGLTDAGFDELAKARVTREEARDIIVLQLQTDWLDVVKGLTHLYGSSRQQTFDGIWPGEIPPLVPEAVWPIRSEQVQCLIDAGGGLEVTDPKTGETLTNGEAQERLHWQYSDLTGYFEWRKDSPGQALHDVLSVVESAVTFAFELQWDSEEYGISSAEIDRRTAEAYDRMYAGLTDTGTDSDRRDVLRDLGFDVDAWYELPDHIIEAAEAKIAPMLSMLPRRIRDVKQLMDLEDKAKQRRDGLISDDDKLKAAIMAAEEIAIEKGQASGDCPPTPDAWLDHRSDAVEAAYSRGLDAAGTDKLIKDPRTGEMISENEALFRLHYEPQETGPNILPDDPAWFSFVDRQSTEAQDVEDATVNLQDIMYTIDHHVRMGDMDFDEMDEEVQSQYELFWRNHANPMAERTLHGELYGDIGGRIYSTLVKRNALPRRVRTYAGLAGLVDKMDTIRAELEAEDFEMLKAIMEGEEQTIARGIGNGPAAYDPELVDRINANIDRLVSYGVRTEIATAYPSYTLNWSNASGQWFIFYPIHKKGEEVRLDANQILVQASRPAIEETLPLLHMLPLFSQSFEYRYRPPTLEEDDLTPSAELGVFYTPEHYDPNIQEYHFYEYGPLDEDDSPYIDAYEHQGTEVSGEGELLDDEVSFHEDMGKAEFLSGETSKSHAIWDIDDVKVEIDYGPWTSRLGEHIDHAAWVSIERYGGAPFDSYMFTPGGPIAKVTDLLDRIHRSNPNLRIVATATRDEERGDIRARVYERYGWRRISGTDASGSVDMELPHPDQRTPRTPTAFDGIAAYADAIMELV